MKFGGSCFIIGLSSFSLASMRTVLCFGDSNTWGANPKNCTRYPVAIRWPGVLRALLGPDWMVVEEGMCGRTTVFDDPIECNRNGADALPVCLESHHPLDLVVILLGTNDLKARFHAPADDIARGAGRLIQLCRQSTSGINGNPPQVLLICPPPLAPLAGLPFATMFAGGEEKSRELAPYFEQIACDYGCHFLDGGTVIETSCVDGIHLDADQHRLLAEAVADHIRVLATKME